MTAADTQKKEDLRIKKTKQALVSSVTELVKSREIDEITVNDICQRAGIRRATFYKHFTDKCDFFLFVITSMRNDFNQTMWKSGIPTDAKTYYTVYFERLIEFLCEYEDEARKLLRSDMRAPLLEKMIAQNYLGTVLFLENCVKTNSSVFNIPLDLAANMLSGGFTYSIIAWFETRRIEEKDKFISDITTLIGCLIQ